MEVACDRIGRATGPYSRNNPRYPVTWWEWVCGSTLFFLNCQKQYQGEVRDGQSHFLMGDCGNFVRKQKSPITPKLGTEELH